jgi:hypothetical protein
MKITKTVTIPAIPERIIWKTTTMCDECGHEIAAYVSICNDCGAELCYKCRHVHPDDIGGDIELVICPSCMQVYQEFAGDIDEAKRALEDIEDLRATKCIMNRKKQNETNKT